jgi:teichuronic acid biosynthesis glycosyltransferase TuaH
MRNPAPNPDGPGHTGPRRLDLLPAITTDDGVGTRSSGPTALPGIAQDVIFTFSYMSWQAAAERGWYMPEDRLAKALVSHERVGRLLVSDLMRSLPAKLLRDVLSRGSGEHEPFPADESTQLMSPVRLRRNYPTSIAAVQRACAAYDRALERRAHEMQLREPVVITANPLMAGFAKFDWARSVTFFAHDDWLAYPLHERWWPAYEESFAHVRERGRRVVSISTAALERIAPTGPSLVVPNGLDPQEWSGPVTAPPDWTVDVARPLVLYVGSLDSRIDIPAMLGLAHELPEITIALVGPLLDAGHLAPLKETANIEIHEPLGREGITALIRCADVGLVPHVSSDLTRAMSPLKLYEYLAGGLPVVAADLPPVRGVSDSVTLVEPGSDYAPGVRAALAIGRSSEADRQSFIASNSWQARQEALLDLALA